MSSARRSAAAAIAAALLSLGGPAALGCLRGHARLAPGVASSFDPAASWARLLPDVQRAAADGRYGDADRLLDGFAQTFPRSWQAGEVHYWRALLRLDPANKESTPQQALASLDAYLALSDSQPHRAEAIVLRRTVTLMRALADSAAASRPAADREKAREEEMQKLRDELAKAQQELERIRLRLRSPKP